MFVSLYDFPRIDMSDYKSETHLSRLLLEAVQRDDITSVGGLLDQGVPVNSRDDQDMYVCVAYLVQLDVFYHISSCCDYYRRQPC